MRIKVAVGGEREVGEQVGIDGELFSSVEADLRAGRRGH
jgi:hypothetical protein